MKIKISLIFISILMLVGIACNKKDDFNYPKDTVGSSKIIYFPTIATNGDRIMAITQNTTFTDPGATAALNGADAQYTTDGTVDPSTPGIYTLTYIAANAQGFTSSDWRMVAVVPTAAAADPVVAANDFSGTYLRAATGLTATWIKVANGVYSVENPAGSGSSIGFFAVATNYSGTNIHIPDQISPQYGEITSTTETYSVGPPATYSWIILTGTFGTGPRSFVKQ